MAEHNVYHFDATQFTSQQLAHPTCADRAIVRALAEGLHAYRLDASTWTVPSGSQTGTAYTVRQWSNRLSCSCECGRSGGTICKHRALVANELSRQQPAAEAKPAAKITSIAQLYDD